MFRVSGDGAVEAGEENDLPADGDGPVAGGHGARGVDRRFASTADDLERIAAARELKTPAEDDLGIERPSDDRRVAARAAGDGEGFSRNSADDVVGIAEAAAVEADGVDVGRVEEIAPAAMPLMPVEEIVMLRARSSPEASMLMLVRPGPLARVAVWPAEWPNRR